MSTPTPAASQLQRTSILSGPVEAAASVRKVCNGIKRMSAITAAGMTTGVDTKEAVTACHAMAVSVLKSIGFDVENEQRLESVLPMVLEATSTVLADAARHATSGRFGGAELEKAAALGASSMAAVAKSRGIARMVEPSWPDDMDATTALRLTAASAMAQVAIEVAEFDFMHPMPECIKEAGRVVVKASLDAARQLSPARAGGAARLMLTQSLIQSGARVYAACWRSLAAEQVAQLDGLSDSACEERLQAMEKAPLAQVLAPVTRRFGEAFGAVAALAAEIVTGNEPPASMPHGAAKELPTAATLRVRRAR